MRRTIYNWYGFGFGFGVRIGIGIMDEKWCTSGVGTYRVRRDATSAYISVKSNGGGEKSNGAVFRGLSRVRWGEAAPQAKNFPGSVTLSLQT